MAVQTGPAMFGVSGAHCGQTAVDGNCVSNHDHGVAEDCTISVVADSVLSATFFDTDGGCQCCQCDQLTLDGVSYYGINTGYGGNPEARGPQGVTMAAGTSFQWQVGTTVANYAYDLHDGWTICRASGTCCRQSCGHEHVVSGHASV